MLTLDKEGKMSRDVEIVVIGEVEEENETHGQSDSKVFKNLVAVDCEAT